jgi:hypothetical protein
MNKKHFEQSMNPKEHTQSELRDAGISHPSEWKKALDLYTPLEEEEEILTPDRRSFKKLAPYLEEDRKISDREKIKKFSETSDSIERLEILRSMSLQDAIECLKNYSNNDDQYRYLAGRLDFYQKFIQGKATYKQTEYDLKKGEYVQVEKEYPIDSSDATPETVRLGILRDIAFASMIGTPELGIFKVAEKRLKANDKSRTHMPELKGYHSGIHENSIGNAYPFLRALYEEAHKSVEGRLRGQQTDPQVLEHRAVILGANWLEEAMNYNDPSRSPKSPYVGSLKESIAWARLGSQVKKQLLGMRQKIQGIDLHNIERFIGRSGDNKYESERRKLFGQIKFLKEGYDQDKKQEFTTKENEFAVQKQHKWFERESERLNHKFEKSKAEIETANLPDDEKELQLQPVVEKHQCAMTELETDYHTQVERLQNRTPEQLLVDLEQRQTSVNERYEKRKSLAQKALDLHFKINHTGGDYNSKPLTGIVDWINYAPFGTVKRAHKMMRLGMSDEVITEYSLADTIAGKRGATRDDLKTTHFLIEKAKGQDYKVRRKLEAMMKVGSILSMAGFKASFDEVAELAGKNFYGMAEALKMYDLGQVKQFIDQGISLWSIIETRKITQKHGYELSPVEVAEIALHNIDGLDDALRTFNLGEVRTLLSQDVDLLVAIAVLNNTRQFGYELDITQITNVAKNVHCINDFTSALRELPLAEVEKLLTVGVLYSGFSKVKVALKKHGYASDFSSTLSSSQKLIKNSEYNNLDRILDFYSLAEVDQIIAKGVTLQNVLNVREALKGKGVQLHLQEILEFVKYAGDFYDSSYYVGRAIDVFGIEGARKIVAKGCRLGEAIEVYNYINDGNGTLEQLREFLKKGGLDVVIAIGKSNNMEAFKKRFTLEDVKKTIEAGFTIEEITRFPFLISPLVTKK